jgi:hypothetical protein
MLWTGAPATGEEPKGDAGTGVVAGIWALDKPVVAAPAAPREFEKWRGQVPPGGGTTMPLERLAIPAREVDSMVRVRGVLVPPRTGGYTVQIVGTDESELWLLDDVTGEWKLIQRKGNPNVGGDRIRLEQGAARTFGFWTMGRKAVEVQWELATRDANNVRTVHVAKEAIPATSMTDPAAKPGSLHGDGLRDEWKQKWGLSTDTGEGPAGPFGDPDGDSVLNWREQIAGTDPLKADAEGRDGLVRWEVWRNIPGRYVFDLGRSGNFPQHPDEIRYLNRLEIPVGNGNEYGSRVRGLIKAPATGEYTFMVIANDTAELWLGENETAQSRRLIARVDQPGVKSRWTRRIGGVEKPLFSEQTGKVTLEEGKRYYVEVLHKQFENEDHCAVGWIVPGAQTPEVIGAGAIVSWKPDPSDVLDDGLPDAWQQSAGLMAGTVDPADRTASADPDQDGLTNWDEYKAGTDPLKAEPVETKNLLTCEVWTGRPGDRISDLVLDKDFPARPAHASLIDNMDFADEGESYGTRLRGYLTAPEDGPYVFEISGNDACILYLARSEDKFTKRVIACTTRGTAWRVYRQNLTQKSGPVELKVGQRYYIEALYKRGELRDPPANQRDHASVAWMRPGRHDMGPTVINAGYFSPYRKDARDLDDDDLSDEWERKHGLDPADPAGANGAWGDPDGDWLENLREYQTELAPQVADVHGTPGFALWECWENVTGDLQALRAHPSFPLHPTRRDWVTALEGPVGLGKFYGSRLRAYLVPPATGDYTFAIAGDDGCELWLSKSELKYDRERIATVARCTGFREWDKEPGQVSQPIHLEAGKRYFIEALHKQNRGGDHVSVAWKPAGSNDFEIIGGSAIAGFAADPNDFDDDDLPDDWEKANGLDPTKPDGNLDLDGDGLTNREEYRLGTRPDRADTDGDGQSDLDEIKAFGTNPLVSDAIGDAVSNVALGTYLSSSINWTMTTDGLLAGSFRGEATWNFSVPGDGNWLLRLKTELMGSRFGNEQMPMVVKVDGQVVGCRDVYFGVGKFGALQVLTQYLDAGTHQVSILVDNMLARRTVRLVSLKVYAPANAAALLAQGNRVINYTATTRTSPLCVEGYARDVSLVKVNGKPATRGMGRDHWYADIPLEAKDELQSYAIDYEPGNGTKATVTWLATNALTGETLAIRRGDSLRVGAWGADSAMTSHLTASSGGSWALTGRQSEVLAFPASGVFTFRGVLQDGSSGTLTVNVVDAPAVPAGTIDALDGTARTIICAAAGTVAFDTGVELATLVVTRPDATTASVSLLPLTPVEFGIAARLGAGGPILGVLQVNVIGISDAIQNSLTTQSNSGISGYKIYNTPLTATNLPAGARIDVSILRAGVMFLNGSTLKSIHPEDLVNGSVTLQFLFPLGVPGAYCHQLLVYDRNGGYLGTR